MEIHEQNMNKKLNYKEFQVFISVFVFVIIHIHMIQTIHLHADSYFCDDTSPCVSKK